MADTVFAQGMFIQERKPTTPQFVLGKFSFKADEFINTLNQHRNQAGYVNVTMMQSKGGKAYLAIDTWQPEPQAPQAPQGYQNPQQPAQGGYTPPQQGYQQPQAPVAPVAPQAPQQGYQMPPQAAGAPMGTPPPGNQPPPPFPPVQEQDQPPF